jgi:hypothetical protein
MRSPSQKHGFQTEDTFCALCREPDTEPGFEKWLDFDRQYSAVWPNITRKKPAPPDADAFVGVPDKFAKYFSPNPGERVKNFRIQYMYIAVASIDNPLPRANRYLPGLCIKLKTELTTNYNIPSQPIWIGVA